MCQFERCVSRRISIFSNITLQIGLLLGLFRSGVLVHFICCCLQAGIDSEVEHSNAKHILLEMGEFFQIQVRIKDQLALKLKFDFNLNLWLKSVFVVGFRMITWIAMATPRLLVRLAQISRTTSAAGWW